MYNLYDLVPVGGFVILDDVMSHNAVMRFWTDFKKDYGLTENLTQIDRHSAWFQKAKSIKVSKKFYHSLVSD